MYRALSILGLNFGGRGRFKITAHGCHARHDCVFDVCVSLGFFQDNDQRGKASI